MQLRGAIFSVQVMVLCLFVLLGHAADAGSNQETLQTPAGASEPLVKALEDFRTAVLAKIDSDVETTARAFWDAYDIQRSRRVADFVLAPLTVIEQAIGTVSFAKNIPEIFTDIERAENILQVVSLFMGLSQLTHVGQNLQVAIDGPAYSSLLKAMLTEAAASTQPGEYATTVKLYLYGIGGERSPVGVSHRPVDGGEPKAEVLWGAEAVKRRISEDISRLVRELETKPVGSGIQVEAIRTHLSTLTQALKRSRADNVTVTSGVVLPASGAPPDLTLGGIGALEQIRREALAQYDNDLRLEQISVLTSAVKAGTQVISLKVGYKTPGGKLLKEVQRDVITPGALLVNTLTKTYATGARYQVAALPHEMVLSLPGELANTWKLLDSIVAIVRTSLTPTTVAGGAKDASPTVQESLQPVFTSTCALEWRYGYGRRYLVKGIIPPSVDLANDEVAKIYIEKAKSFLFQQCPELRKFRSLQPTDEFKGISIELYRGDDRWKLSPDVEEAHTKSVNKYQNIWRDKGVWWQRRISAIQQIETWLTQARANIREAEEQSGQKAHYEFISVNDGHSEPICGNVTSFTIKVRVPSTIDLSNDNLAKSYTILAIDEAFRRCRIIPLPGSWASFAVRLYQYPDNDEWISLQGEYGAVSGAWAVWNRSNDYGFELSGYVNKVQKIREAVDERRRQAQQREAAQRPIKERFDAFFRNHRADDAVSCESLERNPFAMEGKTVVMRLRFEQMIAKDQAVLVTGNFWGGGCAVLVSGVPQGTFSTQRVEVLLAGKVLGNTKVSLGPVTLQVPHLRFGGHYVCKAENCADIIPNR